MRLPWQKRHDFWCRFFDHAYEFVGTKPGRHEEGVLFIYRCKFCGAEYCT